ncbi:MAG: DUF1513 domain-containing protein [Zoogloeaceae bacterium]|jgi:hypothetical protein|nr:DUF1513 domain-containing protein [Zoogloeaceae bacterium]
MPNPFFAHEKTRFYSGRRQFFKTSLASVLGACLPHSPALAMGGEAPLPDGAKETLFGGSRFKVRPDAPIAYAIARLDPWKRQIWRRPCGFLLHGWALHPRNPALCFFFEKEGAGAALFNLETLETLEVLPPQGERRFYGHGAVAHDGQWLLTTETEPDGHGVIGVRDLATLAYLGDFPSYGQNPHDCHLLEGGRVLAISNGGARFDSDGKAKEGAPCVSYVDLATRQLLSRHEMPDARFNTGHLAPLDASPKKSSRGKTRSSPAVVVSAPRRGLGAEHLGAVSFCDGESPELTLWQAPESLTPPLLGEALSVLALTEQNLAIVTHPTPGLLTLWQLNSGKFLRALPAPSARGLALSADKKRVWVSYSEKGGRPLLGSLDLRADNAELQPVFYDAMLSGSHLLNRPLRLAQK